MRRHSECAVLLYVLAIFGYVVFLCAYWPISLFYQSVTEIKRRYERMLGTFDGWIV